MGIPQQRERVIVDGLGNVGAGKYTETNEPTKIPSLGSRITDKVTPEERRELLTRGGRNTNSEGGNSTPGGVAKSSGSGIIPLEDIEIFRTLSAKAKNYNVLDPQSGEYFNFVEGTRIQNAQEFAGKGCKKPLSEEVAEGLSEQIGGTPLKWQHAKGDDVIDYYGENRKAEVHWFQEETVGKHKFKVKRWLDDED